MRSLSPRLACAFLRRRVRPKLVGAASLQEAARAFDLPLTYSPPSGGFRAERVGGVRGEWAGTGGAGVTLLYLHGGAFFAGTPVFYRPLACAFASQGFDVFTPAYRLAPRYAFPAALEDALAVFRALTEDGRPVALAGDSAGGGLALSLMLAQRDAKGALPVAAALFSPWTDLAVKGASARENEAADPLFTRRMLKIAARAYLAGERPEEPLASPLYGDLGGLPPLLVHAGADELLRDDAVRLAEKAQGAGTSADLALWPEVPHCWQLAAGLMPQADESLAQAAEFLHGRSDASTPSAACAMSRARTGCNWTA
jgi:monoterpene epsilon-lactone hydrolase